MASAVVGETNAMPSADLEQGKNLQQNCWIRFSASHAKASRIFSSSHVEAPQKLVQRACIKALPWHARKLTCAPRFPRIIMGGIPDSCWCFVFSPLFLFFDAKDHNAHLEIREIRFEVSPREGPFAAFASKVGTGGRKRRRRKNG